MTRSETSDFTVLGCGVAGAAIAYELIQRRAGRVTVLYQQALPGSSMTNQKWKHSGLFYPRRELARELWDAFQGMHELERQHLQRRGG
ncbi:MAG: FAD-binding oxidoreductase, partial [Chloroflexi bacterium]|nr:FAD-binding oxidoreductase [Chloroflexota bacterium]